MAAKEHGFIKLYRSMADWEWYTDGPTKAVFLHLLLTANYRPKQWKGVAIGRGQRAASYATLARECGLTVSQARTAVMHLKRTGEIAVEVTRNFSLITVCNYERFQGFEEDRPVLPQAGPQSGSVGGQPESPALAHGRSTPFATTKEEEEVLEIFKAHAKGGGALFAALADFAQMRRDRGRPMTKRAAQLLCSRLGKLEAAGEDVCACVENSVLYGWTGVYPTGGGPGGGYTARSAGTAHKQKPRAAEIYHSGRYDFAEIDRMAGEKLKARAGKAESESRPRL